MGAPEAGAPQRVPKAGAPRRTKVPAISQACARIIPLLIITYGFYASYVVVKPLCINRLLSHGKHHNPGAAGAIITFHFLLLLPLAATYFRLQGIFLFNPGYVPPRTKSAHLRCPTNPSLPQDLERFWCRSAYTCVDENGIPRYCAECGTWKPDRTHHCSDTARCVRKMDHFCPFVGGVVNERSMNFFLQFLGWATLWTFFLIVIFAWALAKGKPVNAQFIVVLVFATIFLLFVFVMFEQTMELVARNYTYIEKVARSDYSREPTYLAICLTPGQPDYPNITTPVQRETPEATRIEVAALKSFPNDRVFAVLRVPAKVNIWDTGSYKENLAQVFGSNPIDWFLPLHHSPCCRHNKCEPEFPIGKEVKRQIQEMGIWWEGEDVEAKESRILDAMI